MVELDKDIKTNVITALPMFKNLEERLDIFSRDMVYKNILKDPNWTSRDNNDNAWNKKNMLDRVNSTLDIAKQKISKPKQQQK